MSQELLIGEVKRLLKPGGIIYISDLWIQKDEYHLTQYKDRKTEHGVYGVFRLPEGATFRHHDRDWIDRLLADFEKIKLFDIKVVTMNGNPAVGFQFIGKKLPR